MAVVLFHKELCRDATVSLHSDDVTGTILAKRGRHLKRADSHVALQTSIAIAQMGIKYIEYVWVLFKMFAFLPSYSFIQSVVHIIASIRMPCYIFTRRLCFLEMAPLLCS